VSSATGCFLPESQVRTIFVVVADVFKQESFQMPFIECDYVIEQIPAAFDPAFGHTILPRAFEGSSHRAHAQRANRNRNLQAILRVPVKNQKPRGRVEGKCFSELLDNPCTARMLRDVAVQDAPTVVTDNEETVEYAERDGRNGEDATLL
jgi:hypothetical protein